MSRTLTLGALLALVWAALSGHYSTEAMIFSFGVLSVAGVTIIGRAMDRQVGDTGVPLGIWGFLVRSPRFILFLAIKIVRANVRVTRLLLDPRVKVEPRILRMKAGQRTDLGRVIYANSITLTPGTLTLDLRGDELLIHALGPVSASSVVDGAMDRAACRFEGGGS